MRFCGMCGRPLEAAAPGRERRRVSVLFIDLASFSDLTRDQDPEQVRDLADDVLTVVAAVIEEYDGYVDAFRGDGLVALFGAPHSHPDDAERAVRAADAALTAIERIGAVRGIPLRGRAGVNTGVVIAGSIGSGRVRDYTVMGSAVNLAARLEAAARSGEVWVGPETFRTVRHRLSFDVSEELALAGFPDVRRAYRLLPDDDPRSADPYAHLAYVGREEEVRRLRAARDEVLATSQAHEVWVVGDVGSGKSRLVREAFHRGSDPRPRTPEHTLTWLRVPVGGDMPWAQLAAAVFGIDETAQSPASRQRLETALAELLPDEPRWRRAILASLDLVEVRPWRRVERRGVDRASLAWRDLIAAHARRRPGAWILVVDDDPRSTPLDAFLGVLTRLEVPLLIVRAGRPRDVPPNVDRIDLAPLSPEQSLRLVQQLVEPAMERAAASLASQLGGIPAHLIELGRALSLHEEGAVSLSLAGLLQAHLDRLEPPARTLLAHASLAGERVWDGLLRELAAGRQGRAVESLVRDKLLVAEPGSSLEGQREYRFQSELLRRAVMRMVPFDERPKVHVRIASWLEANAPLAVSEAIAEQFALGGASEAAYAHWMTAAEHAETDGDHARSDALFERALGLDVGDELRAQAALAWAHSALDRGDASTTRTALERAEPFIGACTAEACVRLRAVRDRLANDLHELSGNAAADDEGAASSP
jgi:class 3 adenylate cyclase